MTAPSPAWATRTAVLDGVLVLGALALLAGGGLVARSGRVLASPPGVVRLARAEDAVVEWRRAGVRGRTLVLAARDVAMDTEPGPLSPANFVHVALREGLVRRVFHAIPAAAWPEVERRLAERPGAVREGDAFRVVFAGSAFVVARADALPPVGEPVLLDLEVDRFEPAEASALLARVARGEPSSDLVVWHGTRAPDGLEALRARAE